MTQETKSQSGSIWVALAALCGAVIAAEIGRQLLRIGCPTGIYENQPAFHADDHGDDRVGEDAWTRTLFARQMHRNPRVELN